MVRIEDIALLLLSGALTVALLTTTAVLWELRVKIRRRNKAIARTARELTRGRQIMVGRSDEPIEVEPESPRRFWRPNHDPAPTYMDRWSLSEEPDTSAPFDIGEDDG